MARPKSFIPEQALQKAMHVFWEKGYEGASIQDLTQAMGINRFSLYDTFGDKHALYLQTLDMYANCVVKSFTRDLHELVERVGPLDAIEQSLLNMVDRAHQPADTCGCLYQRAVTEMASADPEVRKRFERSQERLHQIYADLLRQARDAGELAEGVRIPDAAWSIILLQMGIVSLDAAPPPRKAGRAAVRTLISTLRA
jgi:TetR/AcrR family transcriptional repressor of nem operon